MIRFHVYIALWLLSSMLYTQYKKRSFSNKMALCVNCWMERAIILFVTCIVLSQGLSITPCGSDRTVSVEEYTQDFVFTCSDVSLDDTLTWVYTETDVNASETIAECVSKSCKYVYSPMIIAILNEFTRRSQVVLPEIVRGRFPDGTWECGQGTSQDSCTMDVIHAAVDTQCYVTINTSDGNVSGICYIPKMFSSLNRYNCTWMEINESGIESTISDSNVSFEKEEIPSTSKGTLYYNGSCSLQTNILPGKQMFGYRAIISPGNVIPVVRYEFVTEDRFVSPEGSITTATENVISFWPTTKDSTASVKDNFSYTNTPLDPSLTETRIRVEYIAIGIGSLVVIVSIVITSMFLCQQRRRKHVTNESDLDDNAKKITLHFTPKDRITSLDDGSRYSRTPESIYTPSPLVHVTAQIAPPKNSSTPTVRRTELTVAQPAAKVSSEEESNIYNEASEEAVGATSSHKLEDRNSRATVYQTRISLDVPKSVDSCCQLQEGESTTSEMDTFCKPIQIIFPDAF